MQIDPRPATTKNPPEQFTGDVWLDPIAQPRDDGQRMFVAKVRFAPGARTAWHSHARGQTLHVTQGVAWVQSRGEEKLVAYPGQTALLPARRGALARRRARLLHGAPGHARQRRRPGRHARPGSSTSPTRSTRLRDRRELGQRRARSGRHHDRARARGVAADDTLSQYTAMWVVRVGTSLYVRSAYGPDSAWYSRAPGTAGQDPRRRRRARCRPRPPRARTTRRTARSTPRSTPSTTGTGPRSSARSSDPTPPPSRSESTP